MTDLATVRILRSETSSDGESRFSTYEAVPFRDKNVLEVLQYIYEELDPSLAFRGPCEANCCKGCTMRINGKPGLACEKRAEADMTIEPLSKFKVIKDLVVDFNESKNQK
ncbi:MAG: 2Fe-2S iron-sulfur cluster-binding protein [Chloroflexota bacterium]|nr:2Fe-2S iron-sulfur cluster-binding protein [Chloroflexota bacterium]